MKKPVRFIASLLVAATLLDSSSGIAQAAAAAPHREAACDAWQTRQALAQTTFVAGRAMIGWARVAVVQAYHHLTPSNVRPPLAAAGILLSGLYAVAAGVARAAQLPYEVASAALARTPAGTHVISVVTEKFIQVGPHGNAWRSFRAAQSVTDANWDAFKAYQSVRDLWTLQPTDVLAIPGTRKVVSLTVSEPGTVDLSSLREQPLWGWLTDALPGLHGWTPEQVALAAVAAIVATVTLWLIVRHHRGQGSKAGAAQIRTALSEIRAQMRVPGADIAALKRRTFALRSEIDALSDSTAREELTNLHGAIEALLANKDLKRSSEAAIEGVPAQPRAKRSPAPAAIPNAPAPVAPPPTPVTESSYSKEAAHLNAQMRAISAALRRGGADLLDAGVQIAGIRSAIHALPEGDEKNELTGRLQVVSDKFVKAKKVHAPSDEAAAVPPTPSAQAPAEQLPVPVAARAAPVEAAPLLVTAPVEAPVEAPAAVAAAASANSEAAPRVGSRLWELSRRVAALVLVFVLSGAYVVAAGAEIFVSNGEDAMTRRLGPRISRLWQEAVHRADAPVAEAFDDEKEPSEPPVLSDPVSYKTPEELDAVLAWVRHQVNTVPEPSILERETWRRMVNTVDVRMTGYPALHDPQRAAKVQALQERLAPLSPSAAKPEPSPATAAAPAPSASSDSRQTIVRALIVVVLVGAGMALVLGLAPSLASVHAEAFQGELELHQANTLTDALKIGLGVALFALVVSKVESILAFARTFQARRRTPVQRPEESPRLKELEALVQQNPAGEARRTLSWRVRAALVSAEAHAVPAEIEAYRRLLAELGETDRSFDARNFDVARARRSESGQALLEPTLLLGALAAAAGIFWTMTQAAISPQAAWAAGSIALLAAGTVLILLKRRGAFSRHAFAVSA